MEIMFIVHVINKPRNNLPVKPSQILINILWTWRKYYYFVRAAGKLWKKSFNINVWSGFHRPGSCSIQTHKLQLILHNKSSNIIA